MLKNILLIIILVVIILSCKKKKEETPEPVNNNPSTSGATTTGGSLYNGTFNAERYCWWGNGTSNFSIYQTKVCLTATAQPATGLFSFGSNMGIVKSNNIQLQHNSAIKIYQDSTGTLSYSNQISFQHNSVLLGNISFTNTDTFPRFLPVLALQINDTLDKGLNFVIPLTGLTYFDKVFAGIYQPSNPLLTAAKTVSFGATNITFTPAELSVLTPGSMHQLRLVIKKYNDQNINGKLFRFENDSYNDFGVYVK